MQVDLAPASASCSALLLPFFCFLWAKHLFAAPVLFQCTKSEDFRPVACQFFSKINVLLRGLVIATDLGAER